MAWPATNAYNIPQIYSQMGEIGHRSLLVMCRHVSESRPPLKAGLWCQTFGNTTYGFALNSRQRIKVMLPL